MSLSTISVVGKGEKRTSLDSYGVERISKFKDILFELTKIRITFFVSVTTFVGFLLHNGGMNFNIILPTIGVLILACGASSLNEFQERNLDARMDRTKSRPIPSGKISPNNALLVSLTLILLGSGLLAIHSIIVFALGLFTLLWYNGIYTYLKQKSAMAIIPGALVGALPPVIGWVASGGNIFDTSIIAFASFMFIWQIPHFWLLLLMYDDEYKNAGFPTLSKLFTYNQITNVTYSWIAILIASSTLFYLSGLSVSIISNILLVLFGFFTLVFSYKVISEKRKEIFKKTFLLINAYVLCVLILISIENIV